MNTKEIKIADYNYDLPDERIAKYPLPERDNSKLLIYKGNEPVSQDVFYNIADYLPKGELMVFNNTKVIQARLHFQKETGAQIEVFLLEPFSPADYEQVFQTRNSCSWICMIGNLKRWKEGVILSLTIPHDKGMVTLTAEKKGVAGTGYVVEFCWKSSEKSEKSEKSENNSCDYSFAEILDMMGELPIPPYLNRKTEDSDLRTYQTVYSKIKGSVAAPTAGLHFTERVLKSLDDAGIDREELTLHVGAGTFKPVKSEQIADHEMHSEFIVVKKETIKKLINHNGSAIAVGTTSVRTLESLYYIGRKIINAMTDGKLPDEEIDLHVNQWEPYDKNVAEVDVIDALKAIEAYLDKHDMFALHTSTQIIIAPGYSFHIVKMIVTNFHQPQSTLLLLVSAFVKGDWHRIYDYALSHDFRFLSYGDSSLLIP
ncbi:MAG: S-adenosylmethionine:tRNA ribosyltransferase-isomerase [Bacteroidaceae bacterium]|nr:S-adenosylmethionine:tRNA ribosyltransferase-isomerase [Bacteroidaceae bacterium]